MMLTVAYLAANQHRYGQPIVFPDSMLINANLYFFTKKTGGYILQWSCWSYVAPDLATKSLSLAISSWRGRHFF